MSPTSARLIALSLVLPLCWVPVSPADAAPPQDEKRKDLMDQLGMPIKKRPPEPVKPDQDDEGNNSNDDADDPPNEIADANHVADDPGHEATSRPRVTYNGRIRKLLDAGCKHCHATGASAGATRFTISGNFDADYRAAKRLVNTKRPKSSVLLTRAAGQGHGGGATFPAGRSKYNSLLDWIEGGALEGASSSASAPATATPPASGPGADPGKSGANNKPKGAGKPNSKLGEAPDPEPKPEPDPALEPSWTEPGVELDDEPEPELLRVGVPYAPRTHELLQAECADCHGQDAMAGGTALSLSGDPLRDYAIVTALVDTDNASASPLLAKARGEAHGGGTSLDTQTAEYQQLLTWIQGGALGPTADDLPLAPAAAASEDNDADDTPTVDATTSASAHTEQPGARLGDGTPVPATTPSRLPFSLPYHLRVNGRFDLAYERRDYKDQPFGPGRNALQTYHHFLFLSRSGAKDPFGFNIELITQQFYEFNARFETQDRRAKFLIKAGKIMVPFGTEPLFHSSYGGKTGFDQELLPVVWSQPGISFNAHVIAGPLTLTSDSYAIQGYGLRAADGVLNLQGDFSSLDSFQFALGERVGLSWRPLSVWYSLQYNPLGFDRRLLMQALDLEFWRLHDVPFLEDVVVGLGLMRADVSGGGPGLDYYHFGSYGQVRYYPIDWLYLQYRWGLKTFDNRRGAYFDDTRIDERDSSSHNLTIGASYKGFFTALQLFWNLEKANEQDNDFLRLTVGYAF